MNWLVILALVCTFGIAFAATALLIPPVMRLCARRGWLAYPAGRRAHVRPTPTVGGIAIYIGFVVALLATFVLCAAVPALQRSSFETLRLVLLLAGGTLIFLMMWLDDVRELSPRAKLLAQCAAALIAVGPFLWDHTAYPDVTGKLTEAQGIIFTAFNLPFSQQINFWQASAWLAIGVTVLWIVAMNNTINFVDGMDGLAAGISLIAALLLGLHALRLDPPQYTIALLPLALAGACAGFLVFNFPPAHIFMGDSGAEFLGYILALSAIIGGAKLATVLLVLGVPILDVAWLIVTRAIGGHSPAHAGRDHLHHRLLALGFSQRQIVVFYYTLSASFGLLGIIGPPPIVKFVAIILLGVLVISVIVYAARHTARDEWRVPSGE